jgi:MATE family multidrug resistance protein
MHKLKTRWQQEAGYRHVLVVAFPLILSTASWSVQHFVDRMFLAWYSPETIAAAMPAGMLHFSLVSIFMGTAGYVNTFVAQYYGAGRHHRIGPALWQGVYIAIIGGIVILSVIPLAEPIFKLVGHSDTIRASEVIYFQTICLGGGFFIGSYALSGFYSGRGKTWPVMWVNVLATAVNLIFDYALIFGNWGFPELGIQGAGIATVIAGVFSFGTFLCIMATGKTNRTYHTLSGWRLDGELFIRLLRFGFPSGVQFFLEMAGFTAFILLVGRLGTDSLAATNIAFNINTLAFMPMIGFGITVSVLVGQYLGAEKIELAQTAAYSGFHMATAYMATIAAAYFLIPDLFVAPFAHGADPQRFGDIYVASVVLLRFVAIYSLFDAMNIIFCSAIKGAGDTRFVMGVTVMLSIFVLILPVYLNVAVFHGGLMTSWGFATVYATALGLVFFLRFRGGKWKTMRVIRKEMPVPEVRPTKLGRVSKL